MNEVQQIHSSELRVENQILQSPNTSIKTKHSILISKGFTNKEAWKYLTIARNMKRK